VRKGFTVLELLVASLLLGMLMTILTMIFNQSSIAWRTGVAGIADLDDVRAKVSDVRYKADNAYVWNSNVKCIRSVFSENGKLLCAESQSPENCRTSVDFGKFVKNDNSGITIATGNNVTDSFGQSNPSSGKKSAAQNYVVNVRSFGPDRNAATRYDNIYSVPYDPNDWDW